MTAYPHPKFWGRVLDKMLMIIAVLGPLATLPQIIEIFSSHNAGEVSLVSWCTYTIFDIPWIIYGVVHKERPIVIAYTLWFLVNGLVTVGVLLYS